MKIKPTSEDIEFTEGLKKEDSIYEDADLKAGKGGEGFMLTEAIFNQGMSKIQNLFT